MRPLIVTTIVATMALMFAPSASSQGYQPRPLLGSDMNPGVVGGFYAAARGPAIASHVQPVHLNAPEGVRLTMPVGETFGDASEDLHVGLTIGNVYRFRITEIPRLEGAELYPTIEIIDRTYPPPGLELKYPIRVDIDADDLLAALAGQMVTRVVYLEDTVGASPLPQDDRPSRPIDAASYQDPLDVADSLGRPVAILRLGSLTPPNQPQLLASFFFGYPAYFPIHRDDQTIVNIEANQ